MTTAKPSLDLLRAMTDEHVLRAIMDGRRLTRTEIASLTGISKPTISDSVRRLTEAGLLADTGERTTGRGRAGSYYSLIPGAGTALVTAITPEGVLAEAVDAFGEVIASTRAELGRSAGARKAASALSRVAQELATQVPLRCAVVSAADPVDRATGRLVRLPDEPFLVGDLDPVSVLEPVVRGEVLVDNDVNWAARAEQGVRAVDDFAYLHLGEGLGAAVVADGAVRRGHGGLVGEIAHLITTGPGGRAMPFTDVFEELGLHRAGSAAIDVHRLWAALDGPALAAVVTAVTGVLSAIVALTDPGVVVLGGAWGGHPAFVDALTAEFAGSARNVPLEVAAAPDPELTAARAHAIEALRENLIARAKSR